MIETSRPFISELDEGMRVDLNGKKTLVCAPIIMTIGDMP